MSIFKGISSSFDLNCNEKCHCVCVLVLQAGLADQAAPIGNPLGFPGSIMLPVTSMHAGGGAPFSPTDFDHAKMGPGRTNILGL